MDIGMIIDKTTRIRDSKDKEDIRTDIHLSYCCGWRDGVNAILKFLESTQKESSKQDETDLVEAINHARYVAFNSKDQACAREHVKLHDWLLELLSHRRAENPSKQKVEVAQRNNKQYFKQTVHREIVSQLENLVFDLKAGGKTTQETPAEQTKQEVPSKSSKQAPEELKGCRTCRYNGGPVGAPKDLQDLMKIECLSPTWKCRTVFRTSCIYWQPKD